MKLILLTLALLIISVSMASAQGHPFETGIYISIYDMDSTRWSMTPDNPQYQAYLKTDLDATLSRFKADGFDTVYLLPGDWMGPKVIWKTDLPFLKTKDEWVNAGRDMMEELLAAADKNDQRVYLCLLGIERNQYDWWQKVFPGEAWTSPDQKMNCFVEQARKVSIPAMREIVRKYGHHPSLVGFGTDEVHFSAKYFNEGLTPGEIGTEAIELYRKRYGEEPPSLAPWPDRVDEKVDRLLRCREEVLTEYHRVLGEACTALGKEYTTTLNSSMLCKLRWEGLGGERAAFGSDTWSISNLKDNSEVCTDFYASRLSTHIQADLTKFFASPVYGKPVNLVLGTQFGPDILAKHLLDTVAEGVDRITYWTNYYYYGDAKDKQQHMTTPADPDRISYLVKAAKEFRRRVPIHPRYDVAIVLNRDWQRDHHRTDDPKESEISRMGHAVDALNMGGYRYDILCDDEAAAGGLKGIPAVVVPLGTGVSEKALSALESYVRDGGLLVVVDGFGTKTPWGDPVSAEFSARVGRLLASKRVVRLPKPIGDYAENKLSDVLKQRGICSKSPLLVDRADIEFEHPEDYDPYWGPKPKFDVNGKAYDLFWSGDRYQAISVGYRSDTGGKFYVISSCAAKLRPYHNMIAGKCAPESEDHDIFLVNSDQEVKVSARKAFVFGRDGKWAERRPDPGTKNIVLQGPVLVRIP